MKNTQLQSKEKVSNISNYSYKYDSNDKIVNLSESVKKANTTGYTRKKLKKIHEKKNSK